jgi:hypothetical protein
MTCLTRLMVSLALALGAADLACASPIAAASFADGSQGATGAGAEPPALAGPAQTVGQPEGSLADGSQPSRLQSAQEREQEDHPHRGALVVPEPATSLLVLAGLLAIGTCARRRQSANEA